MVPEYIVTNRMLTKQHIVVNNPYLISQILLFE